MTDRKPLFVNWCAKDVLDDMTQMDVMTELVYRRLIDMILASDDNLRDDDKVLYHSTKAGAKWKKVKHDLINVHQKIYLEDGKIRSSVCSEKLEKTRAKIKQASDAGNKSVEQRNVLKTIKTNSTDVEISLTENTEIPPTDGQLTTNYLTKKEEKKERKTPLPPKPSPGTPTLAITSLMAFEHHPLAAHRVWWKERYPEINIDTVREALIASCKADGRYPSDWWEKLKLWGGYRHEKYHEKRGTTPEMVTTRKKASADNFALMQELTGMKQ